MIHTRLAAASAIALALAAGCLPVPTFVGRSPMAVPRETTRWGYGFGGSSYERTRDDETEHTVGLAYGYLTADLGFGGGADARIAFSTSPDDDTTPASTSTTNDDGGRNYTQLAVVVRQQLAGRPLYGRFAGGEFLVGVEAGGSAAKTITGDEYSDGHVGMSLAVETLRAVPYITYRHHWGSDPWGSFALHAVFLGVEFGSYHTYAIEAFHIWSNGGPPEDGTSTFIGCGLNLSCRWAY